MKSKFKNSGEREAAYLPAIRALAPALLFMPIEGFENDPKLPPTRLYTATCVMIIAAAFGSTAQGGSMTLDEFERWTGILRDELAWAVGFYANDPRYEVARRDWNEAIGAIDEARRVAKATPTFPL